MKPITFHIAKRLFSRRLAEGVSQPPWSWRAALLAVAISFAGFMGLPFLLHAMWPNGLRYAKVWSSLAGAVPMLCCLAYLTRRARTSVGWVFGLQGARVSQVVISSFLLYVWSALLILMAGSVSEWFGFAPTARAQDQASVIASSVFIFTVATVWVPLCEELWFRALLYTSLRTRVGVVLSSIVTAAAFVAIHRPNSISEAAVRFCPAVLSSLWYERTRSLWPNVIEHSLNNIVIALVWGGTKS